MNRLIDAFEGLFTATSIAGGELGETASFALEHIDWKRKVDAHDPQSHPIADTQLELACENSGQYGSNSHMLAEALLAVRDQLRWFGTFGDREDEPDLAVFSRNYTGCCVIGRGGLLPCDKVAAGFSLQGRDTYYPSHAHQAEESYWIVGGNGDWKVGIDPWFPVEAGDSIYHPTGVRHAMQTNDQPLLAIWMWTSHLDSEVVIVRG